MQKKILAVLLASMFVGQAWAEDKTISIGAQDMPGALHSLASQTGIQLLFTEDELKNIQAKEISGSMSAEEALKRLLEGTGYTYRTTGNGSYVLQRPGTKLMLNEVTVTATRTERRVDEVPASVSVITANDLRKQHIVKPQDALRNVEGVDFNTSTSLGSADVPQIRGIGGSFSGTTSSVMVDGMATDSAVSSVAGRGGFNFLAPQDIERMEVVRGPASALYGSNVIGGVVNVIAKRWSGEPGAEVNAEVGSHNARAIGLATGMANERFDVRLSAYDFHTDGYRAKAIDVNSRNWQDRKLNLNGAVRPADDQEISFGFQQYRTNQPNFGGLTESSGKQEGDAYTVGYRKDIAGHGALKVNYRHLNLLQSWVDPGGMGIGNRKSLSDTIDSQVDLHPVENNVLILGASYQDADYKETDLEADWNTKFTAKSTGIFIQDEHRFGALGVTAGARYDHIDLSQVLVNDAPKNGNSSVENVVNPRLGARYHLTEATSVYASVGTAYLPASNNFKFVKPSTTRVDNPDLKAETSTSYEVGMNSRWSTGSVRAALFHTDYKDKITLGTDSVSGLRQWQNIAIVKVDGVELGYQGNLDESWQPYANYSYTRARDYATSGATGTQSTRMSPHKINVGVTYAPSDTWFATLNARYADGRYFNNLTEAQWADGYTQADVKLGYKLPVQGQKLEAFFAVNNLTDKKYEPFNKTEWSDGRTFTVGVSGKF